jgi:uroporphyrinogen decarboxylase
MLKTVCAALNARAVRPAIHICGNVTDRLDLLAETGAAFISVDYKVNLAAVRTAFSGKTAFAGNMNPVDIMQKASPSVVEEACKTCLATAGGSTGYIIMPGCDIPPTTPIENIKAMTKTGK